VRSRRACGSRAAATSRASGSASPCSIGSASSTRSPTFASVYKGFDEADDFARELTLLAKSTEPKRSYRDPDA
jgi:hypothetical protein